MEVPSLHNPQTTGLVERKNGILKQQMKLSTSEITFSLVDKSTILASIHFNDQSVGPVASYARLGTPAKTPKP